MENERLKAEIGQRVKNIRKDLAENQSVFAAGCAISQSQLAAIENGTRLPSLPVFCNIITYSGSRSELATYAYVLDGQISATPKSTPKYTPNAEKEAGLEGQIETLFRAVLRIENDLGEQRDEIAALRGKNNGSVEAG